MNKTTGVLLDPSRPARSVAWLVAPLLAFVWLSPTAQSVAASSRVSNSWSTVATGVWQEDETTAGYFKRLGLGSVLTVMFVFDVNEPQSPNSIPFYKRLKEIPGLDGKKARLIALTRGGVIPVLDMFEKEGFRVSRAGSYPVDPAGLPTETGSVFVVDAKAQLLKAWPGFPNRQRQDVIVDFVTAALK